MTHRCPFTLGELMATYAILVNSRTPGSQRLADRFREHVAQHPAPKGDDR